MKNNQKKIILPRGWQEMKLGDVARIFDGTHQTPDYTESGVPFYSVEHVTANDFSDTKYVSEEIFKKESKRVSIEKGDILMTRIGDVGTARHIDWNARASFYVSLALIKCKKIVDTKFLTFFINSSHFQKEIWRKTIHVAFPNKINLGDISKCRVILPPLTTQKKIVSILEIWERVINKLSKKIKIKKDIKQGLMRDLLTGKKRLKGFTDKWETVKLEDIANFRRGSFPQPYGLSKWYDDLNGVPFIQVYDVDNNFQLKRKTKRKISSAAQKMSVYIPSGSIVLTIQGSIGRIAITDYDAYLDRTLLFFQSFKRPISKVFFMYSVFLLFEIEKNKADGGTIKTITKETLNKFIIKVTSLEEQTAIANILIALDSEIQKLEKKLKIIKNLKKYLLNNLITGAIRIKA